MALNKPTVFITGSNRGIGFETARQLALKGFRVIISGRDEEKIKEALQKLRKITGDVDTVLMDVSDVNSIDHAAAQLYKEKIRLDVLINNAAILPDDDQSLTRNTPSILENVIATNCFGPLNVVRSFLPMLHSPSKIINLSSGGGSMTEPVGGWSPAYCVSKSMLNAITRQLAHELKNKNISVNAVCPGWVRTDMGGKSASRTVEHGAETITWLAADASFHLTGKFFRDKKEIPW